MDYSEKLTAQKIVDYLESNQLEKVEDMKLTLNENLFNATKDAWPVNGFFDYYMTSGSLRVIEVLVAVKEPHDRHLLDKLTETLRSPQKLKGLQFFGYLTKKEPPWLYKIAQHSASKELIKILKTETDEVVIVNAALVLASLLPIIPAAIPKVFDDVCTIFNRLTVWHTVRSSSSQMFLIHLRLAIAALFHRLYGMFPVNFLSFMRSHIGLKESVISFRTSLKPLLDTVKINPLLVTATKESEMHESRWRGMDTCDILGECYQLVLSIHPFRDEEIEDFWKEETTEEAGMSFHIEQVEALSSESMLCENLHALLNDSSQWMSLTQTIREAVGARGGRASDIPHTPLSTGPRVSTPHEKNIPRQPFPEQAVEATPETTPYTTPVKELEARMKNPLSNPQVTKLSGRPVATRVTLGESQALPEKPGEDLGQVERRGSLLSQKLQLVHQDRRASSEGREEGKSLVARKNVVLFPLKMDNTVSTQGLVSPVKFTDNKIRTAPLPNPIESSRPYLHDVVTREDREVSSVLSPSEPTTPDEEKSEDEELTTRKETLIDELKEEIEEKKFLEETSDDGSSEATFVGAGSFPESKKHFPKRRLRYHSCCFIGGNNFGESGVKRQKSFSSPSINREVIMEGSNPRLNDTISTPEEVVYESKACQTDPECELPVSHLLPFLFPVVCDDSLNQSASIPTTPPQRYPSIYQTAEESMEKYMEYAIQYHRRGAENIMVNKGLADEWDDPPMLRNQVLLLHMQLLFEQKQRFLHAERSRKLATKLRRSKTLDEQNRQTEEQLREALAATVVLKYELEQMRKQKNALENQIADFKSAHEYQIKSLQQQLKESQSQNELSKNRIQKLTEDNKKLRQDLDRACGQKVDVENCNRFLKSEGEAAVALRHEITEMKHRFVVLGEINHRLTAEVQSLSTTTGTDSHEMEMFKEASKLEIAETKFACEESMRERDAAMARIEDMEKQIREKNSILESFKEQLASANAAHLGMLKEEKSHHEVLLSMISQLESEKLYLQQRLEKKQQEGHRREKHSIPITGARRLDIESGQSPASTGSSLSNQSLSGATGSPSDLSVSLAMEVSEGFNELQFYNLEGVAKKQDNGGGS